MPNWREDQLEGKLQVTQGSCSTNANPGEQTEPDRLNVAAIRTLLQDAFTARELRRFCHDRPRLRQVLHSFGPEFSFADMIDAVINYCEKRLLLPELLAEVQAHNPGQFSRHVAKIYEGGVFMPDAAVRLPWRQAGYSQPLSQGLLALAQLMQSPAVRSAVGAFRADLETTREQVGVVSDYKDMHDLLHKLQLQCYNRLLQEARRFPHDEIALENLEDHGFTLKGIVDQLRQIADRASFASHEIAWIQDLSRANRELAGAIDDVDTKRLRRAILLVKRVLDVQLSQMNTRLNDKARALRLSALVERMMRVRDSLDHPDLAPERISQFETGLETLDSLNQRLMTLVQEHDMWQDIDCELRMIESFLEEMDELELLWEGIREKATPMCANNPEAWAISLGRISVSLESAITARDPTNIKRQFRRYRRQVDARFYQVDVDLKSLCDDLRQVGEPLDSVLQMMEG
jgi:hypothetical protein